MHDLDILVPSPIHVRVGGQEYRLMPRDGLPLAAVLEAQRFVGDDAAQRDPGSIAAFLAKVTPIPEDVLRGLRIAQFNALLALIFPQDEKSPADEAAQGNA